MRTSTVPAVRARLVELFRAHATLGLVQVEPMHPGDTIAPESIFGGPARGQHGAAAIGSNRQRRQETYGLVWFIDVLVEGSDDVQAVEERCFQLFAALEDVLAEDPTLGLVDANGVKVILSAQVGEWTEGVGRTTGAGAQLEVTVDVTARLT